MPRTPPILLGPRLMLRLATRADVPAILRFHRANKTHFEVHASPQPDHFYTEEFWQARVDAAAEDYAGDRGCSLWGFLRDDPDEPIAFVNFFSFIRGACQACILGYQLAERSQGQGLMTEALRLATRFAFDELHMHRIMANHGPLNQRSARVLQRLGFVVEGYAREYLLIHGQWQDHVLTALTCDDWTPPEPES